jgi:hypothetical protein
LFVGIEQPPYKYLIYYTIRAAINAATPDASLWFAKWLGAADNIIVARH